MKDFNSIYSKISGILIKTYIKLFKRSTIHISKGVTFYKAPYIKVIKSCNLSLGENVVIGSDKKRYHSFMYSHTKIIIDRPNAKITIGSNTRLKGVLLHAYKNVQIGKNCLIAANTQIIDGGGHDLCMDHPELRYQTLGDAKPIIIEDNVWIGINCIILPGSFIGEGTIVGAGSVVRGELKSRSIYAGNPVKLIKSYEGE